MGKDTSRKLETVLRKNTYYFYNRDFEEKFEAEHIGALRDLLVLFRQNTNEKNINVVKREAEKLLLEKELGLRALLALTGLSNESLKRIITLARITDDQEFCKLINKQEWADASPMHNDMFSEWGDKKIAKHLRDNNNRGLRAGIVNILAEGASVPFLVRTLPPFESQKLRLGKLTFDLDEMIDTIVRYKEKGGYSGKAENNAETAIAKAIEAVGLTFDKGDLPKLQETARDQKRTMDFIIPNKNTPRVIIESSHLSTTSSGQGDKAKTEIGMRDLLRKHYENCLFWGFVDGIGWYVRQGDLRRMVEAYDDVFTLAPEELKRFSANLTRAVAA